MIKYHVNRKKYLSRFYFVIKKTSVNAKTLQAIKKSNLTLICNTFLSILNFWGFNMVRFYSDTKVGRISVIQYDKSHLKSILLATIMDNSLTAQFSTNKLL